MKKEEIRQFDQLKEQQQKDKQKEQQKENEITKISQEKEILEAVVKTLRNCDRITINHALDKDQQIKDLKKTAIKRKRYWANISKRQHRNEIKSKQTINHIKTKRARRKGKQE